MRRCISTGTGALELPVFSARISAMSPVRSALPNAVRYSADAEKSAATAFSAARTASGAISCTGLRISESMRAARCAVSISRSSSV